VPRPRVVLLRGHNANVWDARPWESLADEYDVELLVTGSNLHETGSSGVRIVEVRTPRDALPGGRAAGAAAYAIGERYLGLEPKLAGATIVHAAELGTWFSAQAARLKDRLGFRLVVTVWETLPWRDTYRWPRERGYRRAVLPAADLFLAATHRAREGLLLEGVPAERIEVAEPGAELARFSAATAVPTPPHHTVLSAGRLVWEKGHQDVLRAIAALRGGLVGEPRSDVRGLVVGSGPEESKLKRYADELGLTGAVEFRATVPYDQMPSLYAGASALALASLPARGWEEQFGMVLAEAMSSGLPIVACSTGAIPEVLGGQGTLVPAGDWMGIARALAAGPLAGAPAARMSYDAERVRYFSAEAAAERLRAAYRRVIG
jgi:glycosyltransferase involved in cell wall biosynthesis